MPPITTTIYQPLPEERVFRLAPEYIGYNSATAAPLLQQHPGIAAPIPCPRPIAVQVVPLIAAAPQTAAWHHQPTTLVAAHQTVAVPYTQGAPAAAVSAAPLVDSSWDAAWAAAEAVVADPDAALEGTMNLGTKPSDNHFVALLESLEARVDLMSQMQQARAAIQRQARTVEALQAIEGCAGAEVAAAWGTPAAAQGAAFDDSLKMWEQFQDQQDCISRLTGEVEGVRRQLLALGTGAEKAAYAAPAAQEASVASVAPSPLDITQPVGPIGKQPGSPDRSPRRPMEPPTMLPFNRETCGVNLSLSEDGYRATRARGCRQSVAIGSGHLAAQAWGCFFEVVVQETVAGWVGGLGIGVTSTSPSDLRRLPDKAWRIPDSFIVGYWGCIFLDGQEHRTAWRSDSLVVGSRVGLLVTNDGRGDLIVFVNGRPVVKVDGALLGDCDDARPKWQEPLYPVVDVFAATRIVELSQHAVPPPPPWCVDESLAWPSAPHSVASPIQGFCGTSVAESLPSPRHRLGALSETVGDDDEDGA